MDLENFEHKELLEQYLLGLTDREQTARVEELLGENPELRAELDRMRDQMESYLSKQGMGPTKTNNTDRPMQDFHDLDHEMITQMTRRNHHLVIWRLALSAACLVLLFISGYLFRENQNIKLAITSEKALHAQDKASHRRKLAAIQGDSIVWDSLHTQTIASDYGEVVVHYLADDDVTFLDMSHLRHLDSGQAYQLEVTPNQGAAQRRTVLDTNRLHLIPILADVDQISIYRGGLPGGSGADSTDVELLTAFELERNTAPRARDK